MQDPERQKAEEEEQMWYEHYGHVRELETCLDEMGVKHHKVKERGHTRNPRKVS